MAAPAGADAIFCLLSKSGVAALYNKFIEQKIDFNMCKGLSDHELTNLGVTTIGERVRFREELKDFENAIPDSGRTEMTRREAANLFRPSRSRYSGHSSVPSAKRQHMKTWTGSFFCFSDRNSEKVPTSTEKIILQRAGLGNKKIQFPLNDDTEAVMEKLKTEYPKLEAAGGFELLRCLPNCRKLEVLECRWDAESLRAFVGGQAKIYLRPIQHSLSIEEVESLQPLLEPGEQCAYCKETIPVKELRNHISHCLLNHENIDQLERNHQPSNVTSQDINEISAIVDDNTEKSLPDINELYQAESGIPDIDEQSFAENPPETSFSEVIEQSTFQENNSMEDVADSITDIVLECSAYCQLNNISDPVKILKIYQAKVVTGRPLDVTNESDTISGETNFILVNRHEIIATSFDEIKGLSNLRTTLEVQFYGETAADYGGPRREFFSIILRKLKEEYFDPPKEWSEDYEVIGKIMALSFLQNGRLPQIMSSDLLEEVFLHDSPRPFVRDLKRGLDSLGIVQLVHQLPTCVHLFTPSNGFPLTLKMITNLLKPQFKEEGTNGRNKQTKRYQQFIKYLREAASGRRGPINLSSILKFVTGAEQEPVLGFALQPTIHFPEMDSLLPTANTCSNRLNVPVSNEIELPRSPEEEKLFEEKLFSMFDLSFSNEYFGLE